MIRRFIPCLLLLMVVSCSNNHFYDTSETYYNEQEASNLITNLKKGTLIVQIPCEKRKLELLEKMVNNASDQENRAKNKEVYSNFKLYLKFVQETIIKATQVHYTYSKFVFVPDTLINAFKTGERKNIFIDDSFEFVDISIEESELKLFLRGHRDYDQLYVHKSDGSFPPKPFPYSSGKTLFQPSDEKAKVASETTAIALFINEALINLNSKLASFYEKNKIKK